MISLIWGRWGRIIKIQLVRDIEDIDLPPWSGNGTILMFETTSRGTGPKTFMKSHQFFLVAITTVDEADDVLFSFRASLDSESYLIGDMLGRNERSEGNGVGFIRRTRIKGAKWRRRRRRRRRRRNGSLRMK